MSNVCFIIYDYTQKGGAERATSKLAGELSKKNNVSIISVFNSHGEFAYEKDKKIRYYKIIGSKGSITRNIVGITKRIRKIIKKNKTDITIAVDMATAFMAVMGTKRTGSGLIVCDRSSCFNESMYKHLAVRFYAWTGVMFSDVVQVMTNDGKDGLVHKYHIKNKKVVVIPNWIDEKAITDFDYDHDQHRIISVGRAAPEKNYEELIKIAGQVKPFAKGWEWHIWGDFSSEYGKRLLEEIKRRNLEDFLIHKGTTGNLYDEYHKYSFFVLTSRFEGMPNVLLEAQGSKLPTVAYDCKTGPSELIKDGVNGFLVKLNDSGAMKERLRELISNKALAEEISGHSDINYVRFSKEKVLEKWEKLLGGVYGQPV